jgi:hypothetical protein
MWYYHYFGPHQCSLTSKIEIIDLPMWTCSRTKADKVERVCVTVPYRLSRLKRQTGNEIYCSPEYHSASCRQ